MDYKDIKIIGGYIPDKPDIRNYSYGSVFGAEPYPRKFHRPDPEVKIPFQGQIPSCVACGLTLLNEYKSLKNDKNNLELSWRRPFSQTGLFNQGRNVEDVLQYIEASGQPQSKYCPNDVSLAEKEFMNPEMTQEALDDEKKRMIGKHWWIRADNLNEICPAVIKEPIAITFGGNNSDWQKPFNEIVRFTPALGADWYHLTVLWDYDLDEGWFRICNWWGDQIRKIAINYPLNSVSSFADIPDERQNTMFRVLKTADKQDNWMITGTNKRRIPDSDTFHYFRGQLGIIDDPEIVTQEELDKYITSESLPSIKLMRVLEEVVRDIYLEE